MKRHARSVAAAVLAVFLSIQVVPVAAAFPRGGRDDFPERITRVLKKLQRLIGISTHEDGPVPPKP